MEDIWIPGQVNLDVAEGEKIIAERATALGISLPESASPYWVLCGICMREGKEAMLQYAKSVMIRMPERERIGIFGPVQRGKEKWWQQCRKYK